MCASVDCDITFNHRPHRLHRSGGVSDLTVSAARPEPVIERVDRRRRPPLGSRNGASRQGIDLQGVKMVVEVTTYSNGDFLAAIFQLRDGRVLVTNNAMPDMAELYRSRTHWETSPETPLEEFASVAEAFAALE